MQSSDDGALRLPLLKGAGRTPVGTARPIRSLVIRNVHQCSISVSLSRTRTLREVPRRATWGDTGYRNSRKQQPEATIEKRTKSHPLLLCLLHEASRLANPVRDLGRGRARL